MIRSRHRKLATHKGDLNLAFHKKVAAMKDLTVRKAYLLGYIKRLGWKVVYVNRNVSHKFWLRNTTYHRTLVLGSGWSKKDKRRQCRVLLHEIVHMRQRKRLGRVRFLAYYALAEYRWALEVSAYRSNRLFSASTISWSWLKKFYRLGRLRDVKDETNAILLAVKNL